MRDGAGFVGREREVRELLAGLDDAVRGRANLFLVSGEPGAGKSRLIEELASRATERGALVLAGRCWEAGGAPPYWPWVQSIRAYVRERDREALAAELGAGAADVAQMVDEVRERFPDLPEPSVIDPEAARFRLFDSTAAFLRNASASQPLVFLLDDLHVADEPSLLLLRFLAREIGAARILILGAYRDTELGPEHPLTGAVADLLREPATRSLPLEGLTEGEVARFIWAATGITPSPDLVQGVHHRTEGNPLFLGELVRLLAAEGRLEGVVDVAELGIPRGVRAVIGRRLARLSERCRSLLTLGSVLGREFGLDALQHASGLSRAEVLATLDEASERRIVTEVPGSLGRLGFSHALVRDAVYEDLPLSRRVQLHRRIGEALEALYAGDLEPHLSELAHHFLAAAPGGDVGAAVEYARRAGERAVAVLAYEEAIRHFRMAEEALRLGPSPDEGSRCELLLALGDAQARAGDDPAAKATFLQAGELARRLRLPERLADAALGYGGRFVWEAGRGDPNLVPLLQEAIAALGDRDSGPRARLLARLAGGPLRDDVDRSHRDALSRRAVEIARRVGEPDTLGYVLDGRYAAVWWPENLDERLEIAAELIRVAEQAGDKERALQGHHYRLLALLESGDMPGVREELAAKARLADELRQPAQQWYLASVRATLAIFEGRYMEAEELIPEAYDLGQRAQGGIATVNLRTHLFMLRKEQGRLDEVRDAIERSVEEFPTYRVWQCVLAHLCAQLGDETAARETFDRLAAGDFVDLPRNDEWLFGMSLLPEVAEFLGDVRRAPTLYELLAPYADRAAVSAPDACTGSVSRPLGILAAMLHRWSEAERQFEEALALNTRMGSRPWVAHTKHAFGRMLVGRGAAADRERALELFSEALGTAKELGMTALAGRCAGWLRREGVALAEEAPLRVTRTFMFTDIVGSTGLLEVIGDEGWHDLRRWHDEALRSLFAEQGGEEVDHLGDGFFVSFGDPKAAVRCAIGIQRRLAEHRRSQGFAPSVRIGLHTAVATREGRGYSGRGVHVAARIGALAEGWEVLASRETLQGAPEVPVGEERSVALKGVTAALKVSAVDWRRG